MRKPTTSLVKNESGMTAVIITMFVMIVLSLMVISFSQIARREQRQALDRQLSSQAFYAAEAGINDMVDWIHKNPGAERRTTCDGIPAGGTTPLPSPQLDQSGTFTYSCVLFDRAIPNLEFGSVEGDQGELISLRTKNTLTELTIEWHGKDDTSRNYSNCVNAGSRFNFPDSNGYNSNCPAGIMRIMLMPVKQGGFNRDDLINGSYTIFLRPVNSGGVATTAYIPHSAPADTQAQIHPVTCSNGGRCRVTISLATMLPPDALFMNMKSVYRPNAVSISGMSGASPAIFTEGQAMVDSTGKANDVLRRLQVRAPIHAMPITSQYVLDVMNGICKQLVVLPNDANNGNCGGNL